MTRKLKILGPYTPEHEGPYAIDTPQAAEPHWIEVNIHCIVDGVAFVTTENAEGPWCIFVSCIMNAKEVPQPREFWIIAGTPCSTFEHAETIRCAAGWKEGAVIHVREVLPGEGE